MSAEDDAKRLAEMQREIKERLRAGFGRVNRLEEPLGREGLGEIEKRITDEYARHNSVRPEEL